MLILIPVFSFTTVFLLVIVIAKFTGVVQHPIDRRVHSIREGTSAHLLSDKENKQVDRTRKILMRLGKRVAPKDEKNRNDVKQRLFKAGYYNDSAYYTYWGIKIVLIVVMPVMVYLLMNFQKTPLVHPLLPTFFAFGFGLFIPDFYLHIIKRKRHEQIFFGLPDALDLLVVCLEAGLGLDAAMLKVSDEFNLSNPVLSEELHMTCAAVRLGQPRNEALHELGERTGVIDLKTLVAVLVQADQFGTSMADALRVHAKDMRTRRRQRAEEMAAKTTVKLIFPLVGFIFPSIFVVLGGPAAIKIMESLIKK